MFRLTVTGWDGFRDDVADGQAHVDQQLRGVVNHGAFNIKQAWKARWSGYAHLPHLPGTISYDLAGGAGVWTAEIGPDKTKRQGPLGNIIEFGSVNNAPIPGGLPAARAEEPLFVNATADEAAKAVGG